MPAHPFEYLAKVAAKYGVDDIQVVQRQQQIIDSLDTEQMIELAHAYREIERRGDSLALSKWILDKGEDELRQERHQMLMLFFLFDALADRGISPFISRAVRLQEEQQPLDWTKLPLELRYLAEPAEKYGRYQFPDEVYDFISTMSASQSAELKEINERSLPDERKVEDFLDSYLMTEHKEAELIYFLFHLIAIANDMGKLK